MAIEERTVPATMTQRYYICDICGSETKTHLSQCYICKKHLCAIHEKYNSILSCVFCESCYDLRDKYEPDIDETNKEFEEYREKHEQLIEARKAICDETVWILKKHWINESSRSEVKKCE